MSISLKKSDITELKSVSNPPEIVKTILAGTMVLFGEGNPTDWRVAKRNMGNTAFLNRLNQFNTDSVSLEAALKARELLTDLSKEKVKSVAFAAVGLYEWCNHVISEVEQKNDDKKPT